MSQINGTYVYTAPDGKTISMTLALYEAWKNNRLLREKLASFKFQEGEEVENPAYKKSIEDLNKGYGAWINEPENNNARYNYSGMHTYFPEGFTATDQGILISPEGKPYVLSTFANSSFSKNYKVDQDHPLQIGFGNEGTPTYRQTVWYPVEAPERTIIKPKDSDYELTEEIIKNSILGEPEEETPPPPISLPTTVTTSGGSVNAGVASSNATASRSIVPWVKAKLPTFDPPIYFVLPINWVGGSNYGKYFIPLLIDYDRAYQNAVLQHAPLEILDQIKEALKKYNEYIDRLFLASHPMTRAYYKSPQVKRNPDQLQGLDTSYIENTDYPDDIEWQDDKVHVFDLRDALEDPDMIDLYPERYNPEAGKVWALRKQGNAMLADPNLVNSPRGRAKIWNFYYNLYLPADNKSDDALYAAETKYYNDLQRVNKQYAPFPTTFTWEGQTYTINGNDDAPNYSARHKGLYFPGYFDFGNGIYYKKGGKVKLCSKYNN